MARKNGGASLDVDAVLAEAEQKSKEKVAQGSIPVLSLPRVTKDGKEQEYTSLDKLHEIATQIDGLVASAEALKTPIMEKVTELHKTHNKSETFATSIRVKGEKSKALVSFTCRYSAIPKTVEPELKEILKDQLEPKDKEIPAIEFSDLFDEDKGVELKDGADLKVLIGALGPELFKQLFVVNRTLKPTRHFHENRRKLFSEKQNALLDQHVKAAAPSFKWEG